MAALLDIVSEATYEAEPAILLQQYAERAEDSGIYRWDTKEGMVLSTYILRQALSDYRSGTPREVVARRFHNTIADILITQSRDMSRQTGIDKIALSGGVWQNLLLLEMVVKGLRKVELKPLIHRKVSPSDEGISLGFLLYGSYTEV